jgi:uncharacterized Zn finger protein (UPF0148 family)
MPSSSPAHCVDCGVELAHSCDLRCASCEAEYHRRARSEYAAHRADVRRAARELWLASRSWTAITVTAPIGRAVTITLQWKKNGYVFCSACEDGSAQELTDSELAAAFAIEHQLEVVRAELARRAALQTAINRLAEPAA